MQELFRRLILFYGIACCVSLTLALPLMAQDKDPTAKGADTKADATKDESAKEEPKKEVAATDPTPAPASPGEPPAAAPAPAPLTVADLKVGVDTMWVLVTGFLVFFMNLGFGCVEAGFCRAKNCVNILSKNFIVFCATSIGFLVLGFDLMFGNGAWIGAAGNFFVGGPDNSPAMADAYNGAYSALSW